MAREKLHSLINNTGFVIGITAILFICLEAFVFITPMSRSAFALTGIIAVNAVALMKV